VTKIGQFFELAQKYGQASELASGVLSLEKTVDKLVDRLYEYGVTAFGETIYFPNNNGNPGEFEAAYEAGRGRQYFLDAMIPHGAEVVQAWVVPYEHLQDVSKFDHFAAEKDSNDQSKIILSVTAVPPDPNNPQKPQPPARLALRIYVLYRQKVS
jgi:hypothetical protein